jgi:hypothetical protein
MPPIDPRLNRIAVVGRFTVSRGKKSTREIVRKVLLIHHPWNLGKADPNQHVREFVSESKSLSGR